MSNRNDRLQVVKKTYCGVTIGYIVGWWFDPARWRGWGYDENTKKRGMSFRSFRNGVVFKTQAKAEKFRDDVEKRREASVVIFEAVPEIKAG